MANPLGTSLDPEDDTHSLQVPQYDLVNDAGGDSPDAWAPRPPRKSNGPSAGGLLDLIPPELPCAKCGVDDRPRLCLNLTLIWFVAGISFILGIVAVGKLPGDSSTAVASTQGSVCRGAGDMRLFGEDVIGNNGHHYQVVGGSYAQITWHQAYADAQQRCYNGVPGHLAHIGSDEENQFLADLALTRATLAGIATHGWIGATDMRSEGQFGWAGGAHDGELFWSTRGLIDGEYANWAPGEPNGENGAEDCVMMYSGTGELDGYWSDEACYSLKEFFIVEYDG